MTFNASPIPDLIGSVLGSKLVEQRVILQEGWRKDCADGSLMSPSECFNPLRLVV